MEIVLIPESHAKWEYVSKNQGRIININDKGHMNSSVDRHGHYKNSISPITKVRKKPIVVNLTKLDDLNIDDSLFKSLLTDTVFDQFCSNDGGFLPGTNVMFAAGAGLGKTTVGVELISKLQDAGKKVLFISAEMNKIDMSRYLQRFPHWGQIPMLFMSDYSETSSKDVIEKVLEQGWDLVFTDSFSEVCDQVKEDSSISRNAAEKWFLQLMDLHNTANNKAKIYTTFLTVLQVGKSGTFVGSNKLKHMSSAMIHMEWCGAENSGRRYMYFSKNRVGHVGKKLYYNLSNGVNFDEERYIRDLQNDITIEKEREQLTAESSAFDVLFGFDKQIPEDLKSELEGSITEL